LKGACPAEPSNAVPVPPSRAVSDNRAEGVSVRQGIAGVDPHKSTLTMAVVEYRGSAVEGDREEVAQCHPILR
jgi:hypothetical protein